LPDVDLIFQLNGLKNRRSGSLCEPGSLAWTTANSKIPLFNFHIEIYSTKQRFKNTIQSPKPMTKGLPLAEIRDSKVLTEDSDEAKELYNQSRFGNLTDSRVELSLFEALYLVEKKKITVIDGKNKPIKQDKLEKRFKKLQKNFLINYAVFKDMRNRGYVIKTALKFGANFRVYDRGVKPGEDHARWILYPVHESGTLTWHEFAAKNRVAHSTKKRLLLGVVDDEGDVSYWEVRWLRP
jgi:tRNA-intron endonuclease